MHYPIKDKHEFNAIMNDPNENHTAIAITWLAQAVFMLIKDRRSCMTNRSLQDLYYREPSPEKNEMDRYL